MSATPIQNAFPGESLIGTEPALLEQVDPGWLHRLALFNGRALTASALESEQAYRAGRLATLGQCVTQGTVKGLELSANLTAADPVFQVSQGYGISAAGEDVTLTRTLRTTLSNLLVIDPQTGAFINTFPNYKANPANTTFAGVLLLQPVAAQVSGAAVDTGTPPVIVSGNLNASCDQDPQEFAFEDWQIVDGARLVLMAWPSNDPALALPSGTPSLNWRNPLAYTIFNAEMALGPDDRLPWDLLGVPVALVVFDTSWNPLFTDRYSVVRAGGLVRSRYVLPVHPSAPGAPLLVQPALAQARILQLTEQVTDQLNATPPLPPTVDFEPIFNFFFPAYAFLPPCGVLPAASMDFILQIALWLPPTWTVTVGPVFEEEIETALLSGMTGQPLDVMQNETVEVLVPLPDALYDPNVLITEQVDPAFQDAVNAATNTLAGDLQHRKAIQQEANALSQALTGTQQPPLYDLNAGLTRAEITLRDQGTYTPASGETFGATTTTPAPTTTGATTTAAPTSTSAPTTTIAPGMTPTGGYVSADRENLITDAGKPPFTITVDGNGNPLSPPLTLFSGDIITDAVKGVIGDIRDLKQNGIQHFIDRINAKLNKANDLLDLAFLTTQADIYRFRKFVLGESDSTALAVSPIVAQIAAGESAAVTATNLQSYLTSILATTAGPTTSTTTTTTPHPATGVFTIGPPVTGLGTFSAGVSFATLVSSPTLFRQVSTGAFATLAPSQVFVPATPGTVAQPASPSDVLGQSPIAGAQLPIRTLTIAERLTPPPSQSGLFYAVGNRVALLQLLADLEITIDDIPVLVDVNPPPPGTTPAGATPPPIFQYMRDPVAGPALLNAVKTPTLPPDQNADEGGLFSTGIHVLEQHSALLRAVEARIQQYRDFLTACGTALSNIQANLPQAQTLIAQFDNTVAQDRQDLAFTTSLLVAEQQRVAAVNAQRAATLQGVQTVAFTRPRTLEAEADVPSRQLVPGNIANPVPTCLQQSVAIPPELREIVGLLREAPVNWMPSVEDLLNRLERPILLLNLAADAQARANLLVQLPPRVSSAVDEPGVYAPVIAGIFTANQLAFNAIQTQRAAFQPAVLANRSWAAQVQILHNVVAPGDLLASSAVHTEVVDATSQLMQQISGVATCLYARASQALPADRLAWAEFLRGTGLILQLQSLAVLPNWNPKDSPDYIQNYVPRQQMQMLVDWLFQQIDPSIPNAVAFMSDVVRVAILLASHAPVGQVIAGAVTLTATPVVGGVISLTLPSDRVVHGMYVHLYSAGTLDSAKALVAQAVVSDLDSSSVRATVTQVFQPGVALQANDVAHFSAQPPQARAVRTFDM